MTVCTKNLDVLLCERTPKLRHASHVFVGFWNAENRLFVTVKSNRATLFKQVALQCLEVTEGTF